MSKFSKNITNLPRSGIRVIMDMAWSMGNDVTRLMVGEPDFSTPVHIIEAAKKSLDAGATRYIANAGLPELRDAAANHFENITGVETNSSNIVITHGAMASIATAIAVTCDAGDEILIPDPGWPNYEMAAMLFQVNPILYPLNMKNDFQPDIKELDKLVTEKTKCIILCNPSNPTGQVYSQETIEALIEFARKNDIFVISDEIYSDIIFEGEYISAAELDCDERVIVVHGVSKSYSMTGFRVGYSRGNEAYIELAAKVQEPLVACGTASSQYAALAALTGPQECVEVMRSAYKKRRDLILNILEENDLKQYTPRGAFYILIDVSISGLSGYDFALKLLKKYRVAVAPGSTFGPNSNAYIRVSLASSEEELIKGIKAIIKMMK